MSIRSLVSVVMVFLNEERFLQEAIDSVFAQSYDNWEMLLVDDGSTDKSSEIALGYAERYSEKMLYLEHDGHRNRGTSASRNLAIRNAKGEYIAFLDADDVWLPCILEQQVAIMDSQPEAALVCGQTLWWYSWTGNPMDVQRDFVQQLDVPLNTLVKPPALLILFLQNEWASLCDILVRRAEVEAVGGCEESFRGMYDDQAFHAKLCLSLPVFVSSECWYRYRQHPQSCVALSHRMNKTYSARRTFLNWLEDYLSKQGVKDSEVWKVLQKELWPFRHPLMSRTSECVQFLIRQAKRSPKLVVGWILPVSVRRWLRTQWQTHKSWPPVGWVRFGSLRRVTPISTNYGFDRGLPIDRYYIERFLSTWAADIQGHVLEIGDDSYTRQFGGNRVIISDVLHVTEGNPKATIVGDLTHADHIPSDFFDSVILAQTLHLIYDVRAALITLYRILKPGGVLLATFPGISQKSHEWDAYWCWSFTTLSARRLFEETFPAADIRVEAHGNVLSAVAFLQGLATQELRQKELDYRDPNYEVLITVRAVKAAVK